MSLPQLPDWVRRLEGGARASAAAINDLALTPTERTVTVAASGQVLPIVYGRAQVPGLLFAQGFIGTDLVVAYMWCVGEIDAVEAVWINDAAVPGGVTVTHYTGTSTQTANATLTSAIAGYNDSVRFQTAAGLRGAAYTVFRIPTGQIDAFPRVRATIRGRKFGGSYSNVPSFFLADMIEDPDYGLGLSVSGLSECLSWNNSPLGETDEPRNRAGVVIASGRPIYPDVLNLLAEYAEAFYVFEGDGVKMIPDAPVDPEAVPVISEANVILGSVTVDTPSTIDTPTEIEILYTEPTTDGEPWPQQSEVTALPGVATGDVERVPTSLSLDGVQRSFEAILRGQSRLARQTNRLNVQWTTTDPGVVYQTGDVVRLTLANRGIDVFVRIQVVSLAGPGRYRVTATRYDDAHYPGDLVLPVDEGTVPVGLIAVLSGSTVPTGWADYTAADGRYVVGAGSTYAVAATGGSASVSFSGNVATGGEHIGSLNLPIPATNNTVFSGSDAKHRSEILGGHVHTISVGATTVNPLRRRNRLVQKTGSDGVSIPAAVRLFGLDNLIHEVATRITTFAGRLLMADSTTANAGGSTTAAANATTGSTAYEHTHTNNLYVWNDLDFTQGFMTPAFTGAAHTHIAGGSITVNPTRRTVSLFGAGGDWAVRPGVIGMWAGSIGALPTDWVLCNGSNGTPDLRNRFIEFNGSGASAAAGNNTATYTGTTDSHSHNHTGSTYSAARTMSYTSHTDDVAHNHNVSLSASCTLPYFALAFIMYAPAA